MNLNASRHEPRVPKPKINVFKLVMLLKFQYKDIYIDIWFETYTLTRKAPKLRNKPKIQKNSSIIELAVQVIYK